jgi:uncharacterized protein (DUF2062 family)
MKGRETEIPQAPASAFTRKRLGYGLVVGMAVASLPWLLTKLNIAVLLYLLLLDWPGNLIALALGGWNARPSTVFLAFSTNLAFYTAVTYRLLARFETRSVSKRNHPRSTT